MRKFVTHIQGHSGENLVDPSLLDNVLIPKNFYHVRNYFNALQHCIWIDSGRKIMEEIDKWFSLRPSIPWSSTGLAKANTI